MSDPGDVLRAPSSLPARVLLRRLREHPQGFDLPAGARVRSVRPDGPAPFVSDWRWHATTADGAALPVGGRSTVTRAARAPQLAVVDVVLAGAFELVPLGSAPAAPPG